MYAREAWCSRGEVSVWGSYMDIWERVWSYKEGEESYIALVK